MTNPLSPAAQAVWRAHEQVLGDECVLTKTDMKALAAAIRAAADQVVPEKLESYGIRYELLRIAAELEGNA